MTLPITDASPWRECDYCGTTTRKRTCGPRCAYLVQGLRDIEVRGMRRPGKSGCFTSDWEMAEREIRVGIAARMVKAGCSPDIAIDEAGFSSDESASAYRALRRRGLKWPHQQHGLKV